jgi:sugar (pentulose or hexulose) kinase
MKKHARIIAIDLGASGGKCFSGTFDDNGFSLKEIHRFTNEAVPYFVADRAGRVEERMFWDDVLIYSNIIAGLRAYRRQVGSEADSIGIDAWGADGAFVTEDGVPLGPMYAYRDHRLDGMGDEVKSRIDARRLYEITGIHFQPFNISNQLLWWIRNRGGLLRKGVRFLPVPTLFAYWLGGVTQIDSTWASITQLMDSKKRKWSREILRALGIPSWIMPEIVAPGTVVGEMRGELAAYLDLNKAKLIAVGSHDTASAYAAAPVSNPSNALIISSGTWSLVGKLVKRPVTGADAMAVNISNEGGIGNIRLLKNCMGTWLAQELRRAWRNREGREMSWDELSRLSAQGTPFSVFIDPDDRSFYNPPNMEQAIVEYCRRSGQEPPRDRGTMLRAVHESLALKYRMVAEQIGAVSGKPNRVVHIIGGGSRNDLLNQMTADACGLKVIAGPEEATAVGNAMAQALGLGVIGRITDALPLIKSAFPIREFKPEKGAAWAGAYEKFRAIVKG